MITQMLIIVEI